MWDNSLMAEHQNNFYGCFDLMLGALWYHASGHSDKHLDIHIVKAVHNPHPLSSAISTMYTIEKKLSRDYKNTCNDQFYIILQQIWERFPFISSMKEEIFPQKLSVPLKI
jgi:hypothetical protein